MTVGSSPTGTSGLRRVHWPDRFDAALVIALAILYASTFLVSGALRSEPWFSPIFMLALVPLLWRSQIPATVLALTIVIPWIVVAFTGVSRQGGDMFLMLPALVALGGVATRTRPAVSAVGAVAVFTSIVLWQMLVWPSGDRVWISASSVVICGLTWALGLYARRVRERIRTAESRYEDAFRAVDSERRRIAAELNVIITAAIGRMRRAAATAHTQIWGDRARAAAAFAEIEATGVEAMHELRRLLDVLHDDPGFDDAHEPAPAAETVTRRFARKLGQIEGSDAAIALGVIVATMYLAATSFGETRMPASLFLGTVLTVLLWRRRFPIAVFVVVVLGNAAAVLLFGDGDYFALESQVSLPSVLVALAAVAAGRPLWASIPALVVAWTYNALPSLPYPAIRAQTLLTDAVIVAAVWIAALVTGRRRTRLQAIQAAEAAAADEVRRERVRIAYQLHDVIGHSITIMVLQAAGAVRIIDEDVGRAAAAIDPIEQSGEDAVRELIELLRILDHSEDAARTEQTVSHGLGDIEQLIDRVRAAVSAIEVRTTGEPGHLEASVDFAAYSVVREALTNALKHGGPGVRVTVTVNWLPSELRLAVISRSGRVSPDSEQRLSGGYGLLGVQERVKVSGGRLSWSWDVDRFRVDAVFPRVAATIR